MIYKPMSPTSLIKTHFYTFSEKTILVKSGSFFLNHYSIRTRTNINMNTLYYWHLAADIKIIRVKPVFKPRRSGLMKLVLFLWFLILIFKENYLWQNAIQDLLIPVLLIKRIILNFEAIPENKNISIF